MVEGGARVVALLLGLTVVELGPAVVVRRGRPEVACGGVLVGGLVGDGCGWSATVVVVLLVNKSTCVVVKTAVQVRPFGASSKGGGQVQIKEPGVLLQPWEQRCR